MQVQQLYVSELCYLCQIITFDTQELTYIGYKEIKKFNWAVRLMPWRRNKIAEKFNEKLMSINANLKFRKELLEKLHNSVGGGEGETVTLLEILQRGGSLI